MISGMGVLKSVKWSAITCLPSLVLLYKNEFCQSWQYISTVQVFKQPLNLCVIYLPFKFKEFGNTHAVIKLLGHKSYHTNADPPNSLCKQCQQQYSVNKKMWLRERESKSEILCEERDGERRKRNIQIDNLLDCSCFYFRFFCHCSFEDSNSNTMPSMANPYHRPMDLGSNDLAHKARKNKEDKYCGVCGDRALGYNFDAISCESCKAFFRRNAPKGLVSHGTYRMKSK